jgi:hypothetical protein
LARPHGKSRLQEVYLRNLKASGSIAESAVKHSPEHQCSILKVKLKDGSSIVFAAASAERIKSLWSLVQ